MNSDMLKQTAKQMVRNGKGLIAADESSGTCQKRFDSVGVPCTEENRRAYRDLILTAPGIESYVSGVILHDETIRQQSLSGKPFPQLLAERGILPGIKVDKGTVDLSLHEGEKVTEGLDGLRERLAEYAKLGARFAKWRAVITIGERMPSRACIAANAHAMARYAALCQEFDIVPIVEPEVLIDGDHSIERCYEVTVCALRKTFKYLAKQDVELGGVILKASMVIAGKKAPLQSTSKQVAEMTIRALKESVTASVGGVVFLSGGQGDEQATENLNEMNKLAMSEQEMLPWSLSFSYARAIQNPALKIWSEDTTNNVQKAQTALAFRCKMNSLAAQGTYDPAMEKERGY
jgi:fructose-bisphosphate aldolase class I